MAYENYEELFPVGAKVRCENEAFPGHWEYGVVDSHRETRYGVSWAIRIDLEDGGYADFDYRYLDADPKLSLVRLIK